MFDLAVELGLFGVAIPVTAEGAYQFEPFKMWMALDMRGLLDALEDLSEDDAAESTELLQMQMLMTEEVLYLSMPALGGWVDVRDAPDTLFAELLALIGSDLDTIADPSLSIDQILGCAEAGSGAATYSTYNDEDVWLVECEIDVAEMLTAVMASEFRDIGLDLVEDGIESLQMRMAISRATGEPLMIESSAALLDMLGFTDDGIDDETNTGLSSYVNTVVTLRSWNEPVSFPTPEPLLDISALDALMGGDGAGWDEQEGDGFRNPPELLTSNELLELARAWALSVDELTLQFDARAVIDGEARTAATAIHSSKPQGAYETAVVIDSAEAFRLLWNRDGIWTGVEEADGQIVWEPSSPAALGFAAVDVDEFLADPEYIDFATYAALLDLAWLSRTIEGGGPPVYELGIESGPRRPGDDYFEPLVELLRAATAELLAESVTIEAIDQVSTIITIHGDSGRIVSQVTTAEFDSSAGRVELAVNTAMSTGGMIEFSSPGG